VSAETSRIRRIWRNPFAQTVAIGLAGMALVALASLYASRTAGRQEAVTDVRILTEIVATAVVEPNLTPELMQGSTDSIAQLDAVIRARVLTGSTTRVKLWTEDGRIVYSDVPALIGERYEFDADKQSSLATGEVISEVSDLQGPENRFETMYGEMLEVYLPIDGPNGERLLYESYFDVSAVSESSDRIFDALAPIVIGSLALLEAIHLLLAWGLNRRLARAQRERERLLRLALDSSNEERRRIAADLHDGVVQELAGTSYAISAAAQSAHASSLHTSPAHTSSPHVQSPASQTATADLDMAAIAVRRSLQSLRSLLVDIYPQSLSGRSIDVALTELLAPVETAGIDTELELEGLPPLSQETSGLVYRVAQEGIRNAMKHGEPTRIAVSVRQDGQQLLTSVTDDGDGFDPSAEVPPDHFGLRLLHDAAAGQGGRLSVESEAGTGTTLTVEVPV